MSNEHVYNMITILLSFKISVVSVLHNEGLVLMIKLLSLINENHYCMICWLVNDYNVICDVQNMFSIIVK